MKNWLLSVFTRRTPDQLLVSVCGAILCLVTAWQVWHAGEELRSKTGVFARLAAIESQLNATAINAKQISADVRDGVHDWRTETQVQAKFVTNALPEVQRKLNASVDNFNATVTDHLQPSIDALGVSAKKLGGTADAATGTANQVTNTLSAHVNPLLDQGTIIVAHSTTAVDSFNTLLRSPDLSEAMHHTDEMTADGAHISGLIRKRADAWLDPPPCQGAHCFLLKTWKVGYGILQLAEPAYYGRQLLTGGPL